MSTKMEAVRAGLAYAKRNPDEDVYLWRMGRSWLYTTNTFEVMKKRVGAKSDDFFMLMPLKDGGYAILDGEGTEVERVEHD